MQAPSRTFAIYLIAACSALLHAGQVAAQVYTNDTGGEVEFYGQFSPTFQYFDDGEKTYSNMADNSHSGSRLGFNLKQAFDGFDFRFNAEVALGLPETGDFSQDEDDPDWEWDKEDIRKMEIIFSGRFGTFYLGQGSMATDGVAEADLSGTTMVGYSLSSADSAGSYQLRDDDTGNQTGVAIGDIFDNFDGSRRARLRYDTPEFNGFTLAAAYGTEVLEDDNDDDFYDIALNYGNTFGDTEVAASIGYAWRDRDEGDTGKAWAGSVSFLHQPTGLNGTFAGGSMDDGGSYYYLKAGWTGNFLSVGSTAFSVDYYDGDDFVSDGASSENWGVQIAQNFDGYNLQAYLGYRSYDYDDDTGVDYHDASSVLAGVIWEF